MIIHHHHHKVTILTPSHHICIEVIHSVNYSNKVSFFKLSVSWEHLYSYRAYKQAHTSANTSGKSFCHSHLPLCEHKQRQTRWWWWYCWHLHITSLPAPSIEDVNAQSTSPRTAAKNLSPSVERNSFIWEAAVEAVLCKDVGATVSDFPSVRPAWVPFVHFISGKQP